MSYKPCSLGGRVVLKNREIIPKHLLIQGALFDSLKKFMLPKDFMQKG